jgi:hypothetical protein
MAAGALRFARGAEAPATQPSELPRSRRWVRAVHHDRHYLSKEGKRETTREEEWLEEWLVSRAVQGGPVFHVGVLYGHCMLPGGTT